MLLTTLTLAIAQTAPLPNLEAGAVWQGETRYLYTSAEHPDETDLYVWKEDFKVVAASDGKLTLDRGRVLIENRTDNQLVPLPEGEMKPYRWTEKWSSTGVEREPALDDSYAHRLWRLALLPPAMGTWEWPSSLKWPSAKASSVSERANGVVLRFVEPSGISAKGRATVDPKTGWPVEGFIEATGVLLPGGDGSLHNLKLEWKTTKFEVRGSLRKR